MPEKEWKDLYMSHSLNELKKRSLIDVKKFGSKPMKNMLEAINKMHKMYEDSENTKDMEAAFFYLSRFFELCVYVQKTKPWPPNDILYFKRSFSTAMNNGMNRLEELQKQLEMRYENEMDDRGKDILQHKIERAVDKEKDDIEEKRLKKSDKDTITIPISDSITPSQLMNCHSDRKKIAIFDVRSVECFQKSKINLNGVKIINIPNETVPSLIGRKLSESDADAAAVWAERKSMDLVVIVGDAADASSAVIKLFRSLRDYDYPVKYKCLQYLEGGFTEWHHKYPTFCTNSNFFDFTKHCAFTSNTPLLLDQVKYPTLEEPASVHKPIKTSSTTNDKMQTPALDSTSRPNNATNFSSIANNATKQVVPTINRQTKPTFVRSEPKPAEVANQNGHAIGEEIITDNEITDKENTEPESENGLKPTKSNNIIVDRSTKPSVLKTTQHVVSDKNQIPKQIQPSSIDEWNKNSSETSFEPLKSDSSSSTSSMKRSSSFPNISKLTDDELTPGRGGDGLGGRGARVAPTPPKYDRSSKPSVLPSSQPSSPPLSHYKQHEVGIASTVVTPGLTGLKNLGNTCYMNSIVQCLSNTDELRREICQFSKEGGVLGGLVGHHPRPTPVALEVDKVVRKLWAGKHKSFPCDELKSVVGKLKTSFRGCEQQDSHEFLTILLDWLHEDLNVPNQDLELGGADEASGERAWGEFRRKNNSIVLDLFYGQLKSTVTCLTCAKQSVTFEPFSNLSLPLPNHVLSDRCTLHDCMELYLKEESISGWNCPSCKTARAATKKIDISKLPPILVIHLKRFTSNGARKKQTLVDFPVERLDMMGHAAKGSEQRNRTYDLYAVSNHYGTMESGHYTAYCLNPDQSRWYEFNDTDVIEIQDKNVRTSAAYILFYRAAKR
ncbi:ubiquitin carboxyl-terminal hydrolase 4 isoform X2 [Nilaparvata lugens]|nr:ubiquitin carboxyl-terminal hydrolase 4 isoform X2 [Nilaparvata lugens]XP_039281816.1 ubiquitin carboxyl-terminal hydrolase 4 isoform X2 [Nilaparvata lugens]